MSTSKPFFTLAPRVQGRAEVRIHAEPPRKSKLGHVHDTHRDCTRPPLSRATSSASELATSAGINEPALVASPSRSKRAFQLIGTPSRGPSDFPSARRTSEADASFRARAGVALINIAGSASAILCNVSSISDCAVCSPTPMESLAALIEARARFCFGEFGFILDSLTKFDFPVSSIG